MTDTTVPKRRRMQLVKAELLAHLSMSADRWACEIDGTEAGTKPFDEWGPDDPFVTVARTYDVKASDLARACRALSQEIEARAVRAGYDEHWDPA